MCNKCDLELEVEGSAFIVLSVEIGTVLKGWHIELHSVRFRPFNSLHLPESGYVCEEHAEVDGVSGNADDAEVVENEVENVGEPKSAAVGHDGRGQLKLAG